MKWIVLFILLLGFVACDATESQIRISEVEQSFFVNKAWEQLSEGERETVTTTLSEASVERGYLTSEGNNFHLVKVDSYDMPILYITPLSRLFDDGTRVVAVTFNTTNDALTGPIIAILLEENGLLVGYLPRL